MSKYRKHRYAIGGDELERRWKLIRDEMNSQDMTLMISCSNHSLQQGYFRYLTGIAMDRAYISPMYGLLPIDDDVIVVRSDSYENCEEVKVNKFEEVTYYRSVHYTNLVDAEVIAKIINERSDKKVGIAGLYNFNYLLFDYLKEHCQDVEWVDCTNFIDDLMSTKSDYEQKLVLDSAKIHDHIMEAIPALLHPGIYEYELKGIIDEMMTGMGSESHLIIIGSSKIGKEPPTYAFAPYLNRQLNVGDQVFVMVECSGPGGYFTESGRIFTIGEEPNEDLLKASELSTEMQSYIASMIKPGVTAEEIRKKTNERLINLGMPPETRIGIHGQGYDIMQRPVFNEGENFAIKAGMNIAIHQTIVIGTAFGFTVDNFLVSEESCDLMMKNPQEVIRI